MATRLLANEIRRLRIAAGLDQRDVGEAIGCGAGRIGHLESRRNRVRESDLAIMLPLYGVDRDRWDWYFALCSKSQESGWWAGDPAIPEWFSVFVGLEWGATEIRTFELGVVPGLLQTPSYMEAAFREDGSGSKRSIAMHIAQRQRRQEALDRDENPLTLHAILDEGPLHRLVGGPEILREQLQHLAKMNSHPHVTIQVLPFSAGGHQGMQSGFHCLDFDAPNDPGVIYVETRRGGLYLEEDADIREYQSVFTTLEVAALSPTESVSMIKKLAKELS